MSLAGGRIFKTSPQEDGDVTLELYPVEEADENNGGMTQYFVGTAGALDSTDPVQTDTTGNLAAGVQILRGAFLVAILWTDDVTATTALTPGPTDQKVYRRFYSKNARVISYKEDYTDKILKATVVFKFPAVTRDGKRRNFRWETTAIAGTTTGVKLPTINYTTADFEK